MSSFLFSSEITFREFYWIQIFTLDLHFYGGYQRPFHISDSIYIEFTVSQHPAVAWRHLSEWIAATLGFLTGLLENKSAYPKKDGFPLTIARGRGRACSSISILPSRPTAAHVWMTADFSLAPVIMSRMLRTFSAIMSSPPAVSSLSSLLLISPYTSSHADVATQVCITSPELELGSHSLQLGIGNDFGELEPGLQNLGASGSDAKVIQEPSVRPRLNHQLHNRLPMWAGGGGVELVRLEDGPLCRKLHHCQKIRQTLLCVWLVWLPGYNCPPEPIFVDFPSNPIRTFLTHNLPDFFHIITSIFTWEKRDNNRHLINSSFPHIFHPVGFPLTDKSFLEYLRDFEAKSGTARKVVYSKVSMRTQFL